MSPLFRSGFILLFLALPTAALAALGTDTPNPVRLAYLDPGSGSFMIQALIAALAGIGVTCRLYWTKIKSILGIATPNDDEDRDADDE